MKKQAKKAAKNNRVLLSAGLIGIALCLGILMFFALTSERTTAVSSASNTVQNGDAQVVRLAVTPYGYEPSTLTVEAGKPVRMIVDGTQATSCTRYIVSKQLGFNKRLESGDNIIEFTAPAAGTYGFSCGMGMVRGTLTVVGKGGEAPAVATAPQQSAGSSCGMGGGCGCGAAVAN